MGSFFLYPFSLLPCLQWPTRLKGTDEVAVKRHNSRPKLVTRGKQARFPGPLGQCKSCARRTEELTKSAGDRLLCRACVRAEDEMKLQPLSSQEQQALDKVSSVLDTVPWRFWKPGEQPARILDWLFLGDLADATDLELLDSRGIGAVLNLIGWWELQALLPEGTDLVSLFGQHDVEYLEADSEDRLFFDIVDMSWPSCERFLEKGQDENRKVLVNCQAGHNRSACMVVCWLVQREGYCLLEALEHVQSLRGTVLSNNGFRLQLVRLALKMDQLGDLPARARTPLVEKNISGDQPVDLGKIINRKRLSVKYGHNSKDWSGQSLEIRCHRQTSIISEEVNGLVSQRKLSLELVACLTHWKKNFLCDYEYTADPPAVIGRGFSGDVVLCRRLHEFGRPQNLRCVKRFNLKAMKPDHLEKLKNEAIIYLSLEHPHIARLFDVYEDEEELSLIMQYCSGGTLQDALHKEFAEEDFKQAAVQMLRVLSYIHSAGIVHRDIKPRNWVYEAERKVLKLIDFGFSAKRLMLGEGFDQLKGCLGTLGYLAPEVVCSAASEETYNETCDIWSLGVVFLEMLGGAGVSVFEKGRGTCDGYTEEVILRDIRDVTEEDILRHLQLAPENSRDFLRRLLRKDPNARCSAAEALQDPYLKEAREQFQQQPNAFPISEVISRFRAYGSSSATTRASMLAMARAPTRLPWKDFCALRATFDLFDAVKLSGSIDLEAFLSVVTSEDDFPSARQEAVGMWKALCGEEESLSYCEFLAALIPPIEDAFEDVSRLGEAEVKIEPSLDQKWDLNQPIAAFLPLLDARNLQEMVFPEDEPVSEVVRSMTCNHFRWVVVQFRSGRQEFFDYMDLCHEIVKKADGHQRIAACQVAQICRMSVGVLANCSGYSSFVPTSVMTPLKKILEMLGRGEGRAVMHRIPLVDMNGELIRVFSCIDFLKLAMCFDVPTAVLKSREARTFDRRNAVLQTLSVPNDKTVLHALHIMDAERLTICAATSLELSGDLGGAVAVGVVAVADLKLVLETEQYHVLEYSIDEFLAWRKHVVTIDSAKLDRQRSLGRFNVQRFNVVSCDRHETLHVLARQLLASKLQRIFLSSHEIARIVGLVSSRDILIEVLDQLVQTSTLSSQVDRSLRDGVRGQKGLS